MVRVTGVYRTTTIAGEQVKSFIPHPLPPLRPGLHIDEKLTLLLTEALAAVSRLNVAGAMVQSPGWFLYGFIRKEALISSQIEGTQATLEDIVSFEATRQATRPADVEEVCNYIDALEYARKELSKPKGLPICSRLLCEIHKRLMTGTRGSDKQPGVIRSSQNWIGGSRPGNASFVPPPPDAVRGALGELERWIHGEDPLPPLVRIGLAHVQFETIHPFLDGNGRIGRLLIMILAEHWKLLSEPLLYISLAFKRNRAEYYERLGAIRIAGDWEGWTGFFLQCVRESADDGVRAAKRLFTVVGKNRQALLSNTAATVTSLRLFDLLPDHPMLTLPRTIELLETTKPTAAKAIDALVRAGILREISGRKRDRVYAYHDYLAVLSEDTNPIEQ